MSWMVGCAQVSTDHRVIVLNLMKQIVDDNKKNISKQLALAIISMAFYEMISSKVKAMIFTLASKRT